MKPRSLVWDLFGDHLRYINDGLVPLRALTDLLATFDISDSTTRVVLARMRREGWFDTVRSGRETSYRLTGRGIATLDEGRTRIFDRVATEWDGLWRMVIYAVPESQRAERDQLRKVLSWHGFGPLASATWISPHDRLDTVTAALRDLSSGRLDLFESRSRGRAADREMAVRCWDLDGLAAEYAELLTQYRHLGRPSALARLKGPTALRRQVSLISSYRTLPFRDPDLPEALLPEGWAGRAVHESFIATHDVLNGAARRFVLDVVAGA